MSDTDWPRAAEAELMDCEREVEVYAQADLAGANAAFVERLAELTTDAAPTARLLDLGCGPGDIPGRLAQRFPDWTITALDGSAAMLDWARRGVEARNVHFVQADALQTPFDDAAFEIVCSNSLLHHVRDPQSLWREMDRLLRPGGLLLVRDLQRPASAERARQLVDDYAAAEPPLFQTEFFRSLQAAYTTDEVQEQLAGLGLGYLSVVAITDRHLDVWGRKPQ